MFYFVEHLPSPSISSNAPNPFYWPTLEYKYKKVSAEDNKRVLGILCRLLLVELITVANIVAISIFVEFILKKLGCS